MFYTEISGHGQNEIDLSCMFPKCVNPQLETGDTKWNNATKRHHCIAHVISLSSGRCDHYIPMDTWL